MGAGPSVPDRRGGSAERGWWRNESLPGGPQSGLRDHFPSVGGLTRHSEVERVGGPSIVVPLLTRRERRLTGSRVPSGDQRLVLGNRGRECLHGHAVLLHPEDGSGREDTGHSRNPPTCPCVVFSGRFFALREGGR